LAITTSMPELLAGSPHGFLDGIEIGDVACQRQTPAVGQRRATRCAAGKSMSANTTRAPR
jgi:hypothetical protein